MILSAFYTLVMFYIAITCEEINNQAHLTTTLEDKCNFGESKFQPEIFHLLSKTILPSLEGTAKGDAGKIGVVGGSTEYTGAPYFSAITALKVGADLVYIITTENASPVIKAYSPDLIVYPYLNSKHSSKIRSLLPKMDVVVIGPGLGREDETLRLIYDIIQDCKTLGKPLIIDADGLYAISKNASVLKDYPCPGVIMTPNQREAKNLKESVDSLVTADWYTYWGDCVSVLVKGQIDDFHSNASRYVWAATGGGSIRRAAGQGDILSGALATFYNWALNTDLCKNENNTQLAQSVASYAATKLTRLCNFKAYKEYGRSMTASDMIKVIHKSFATMFFEAKKKIDVKRFLISCQFRVYVPVVQY